MGSAIITVNPQDVSGGIGVRVVTPGRGAHDLWIRSSQALSEPDDLTPWAMTLLPYAMRMQIPLQLNGSVDEALLDNLARVQELLHKWYPARLRRVPIEAKSTTRRPRAARRAAFFSGGVDSFYTAYQNQSNLDALVFIAGFDVPLAHRNKIERISAVMSTTAEEIGLSTVQVSTNLRSIFELGQGKDAITSWGYEQHGASLAAVAYSLSDHIGAMSIASSYVEEDLHPWGSHPDLDPLWSSSSQRILHDSTSEIRVDKIARIMRHESARVGLRVCWMDTEEYNCGRCEKCVRTRVNLRAAGYDGACTTLPSLTVEEVRRMRLADAGARIFAEENLRYMRSNDVLDAELEAALSGAIAKGERVGRAIDALDKIPGARLGFRAAKNFFKKS